MATTKLKTVKEYSIARLVGVVVNARLVVVALFGSGCLDGSGDIAIDGGSVTLEGVGVP